MTSEILKSVITTLTTGKISESVSHSIMVNSLRVLFVCIALTAIDYYNLVKDQIANMKEIDFICKNRDCSFNRLVKVSPKEFEELVRSDAKYGNCDIADLAVKGPNGNWFFYNELGRKTYALAATLKNPEFNPNEDKTYKDFYYVSKHDTLHYYFSKGYTVPNLKGDIVIDRKHIDKALKGKAFSKFGKNTEVFSFEKEKYAKFMNEIKLGRRRFMDKKFGVSEYITTIGDDVTCHMGFPEFDHITNIDDRVYIACKKGALDEYKDKIKLNCPKEINLTDEEIEKKEIRYVCKKARCNPCDLVKITNAQYREAVCSDKDNASGKLESLFIEGFNGDMFLHNKEGLILYCKAMTLNSSVFNPHAIVKYEDLLYIDEGDDLFNSVKLEGWTVFYDYDKPAIFKREKLRKAVERSINYNSNTPLKVSAFTQESLAKLKRSIERARISATLKAKKKIDPSIFKCFDIVGQLEEEDVIYVSHMPDALDPYLEQQPADQ